MIQPVSVDLSIYGLKDVKIYVRVIISIMVLCNASNIVEYDRRRSGLSNAALDHNMEYD